MNDTHPAAAEVQVSLLRAAGGTKRASIALRLSQDVIGRSRRALAAQMPGASEAEVRLRWAEIWYGADLAERVRRYIEARSTAR